MSRFRVVDFEEYEPESVAQARIISGWQGQWRRKDGTLREMPDGQ